MERGIYLMRILFGNIYEQQELRSHVQLRTHRESVSRIGQVTTDSDSHHFDGLVQCRHFENIPGIAGNRCIERDRSLTGLNGQTTVSIF